MNKVTHQFITEEYEGIEFLNVPDAELLIRARLFTANAYAPYSNFKVAAVAKLVDGQIVKGVNQENAAYPVCICAERVLLSTAAMLHPNVGIETMAISYLNENGSSETPISPCGVCRQSLVEYQQRTNQVIRLILSGQKGKVFIVENVESLLPLSFSNKSMM
jgi:cytidine deaminase